MSIQVNCPNGHRLKVKDHWAGRSGLCPKCRASIEVPEPAGSMQSISDDDVLAIMGDPPESAKSSSSSVMDGSDFDIHSEASGLSLIQKGVVHHKKHCRECGEAADLWFAKCPQCGSFFDDM